MSGPRPFRCYLPNDGETLERARMIEAWGAWDAAEKLSEKVYNDGNTEPGFWPLTVAVLEVHSNEETRHVVELDWDPVFTASPE